MNKSHAIYMFNGIPNLALGLGISKAAIYKWPDELPQRTVDQITGAANRLGINQDIKEPVIPINGDSDG